VWARTVGLRGCGYFPGIRIIPDYQAQFAETFIIMSSNGRKIPEDESANAASDDDTRIPMADEILDDEEELATTEEESNAASNVATGGGPDSLTLLDGDDLTSEEQEEKARLIAQVLELQNTLDDLSSRVDNVKEENLRLRSENQVLGQYIENLMAASSVFQPANGEPAGRAGGQAGAGAGGGGYGKKK